MVTYETLYEKQSRTPVCWDGVVDWQSIGSNYIQWIVDKVKIIREMLKAT